MAGVFHSQLTPRLVCSGRCCFLDTGRNLKHADFTTLPAGIFEGLTGLETLYVMEMFVPVDRDGECTVLSVLGCCVRGDVPDNVEWKA